MRILLVDDERAVLLALDALLGGRGFTVERAAGLAEAYRRLHGPEYDVVVTDLDLGSCRADEGLAVADLARRRSVLTSIVLFTGSPELAAGALAEGRVTHVVAKPAVQALDELILRLAGAARGEGRRGQAQSGFADQDERCPERRVLRDGGGSERSGQLDGAGA